MISNENEFNYKAIDLEIYNFNIKFIFIQLDLKILLVFMLHHGYHHRFMYKQLVKIDRFSPLVGGTNR